LFFGFATLLLLSILNRRFTREENVMEVAAMLGLVYAGYFCADSVWSMSGVLATVVQGITIKFFGRAVMNDKKLLDDFWVLLEGLLNMVLFTLGKQRPFEGS
jgi:NhaP-type Na+/H+ or K+/H+ antiporter